MRSLDQAGVQGFIRVVRGQRVMLDSDLAALYEVTTSSLNQAVSRNLDRFPADFMFQLTAAEYASLRFQSGTLKRGAHSKYLPRVFSEQGVAMLSSVLKSDRAIHMNIAIMRAFVSLRKGPSRRNVARQLDELENRVEGHDADIKGIVLALRQMLEAEPVRPTVGFQPKT